MKKIYIAHPYNGEESNKLSVEGIIRSLVISGYDALFISPIHAFGFLYNDIPYDDGMELCFELLKDCDELWLCNDWETSKGCKLEKDFAVEHNIEISYLRTNCKKNKNGIASIIKSTEQTL